MKTPLERQRAGKMADKLQAEQQEKGGEFTDWFEDLYAKAEGDSGLIPWGNEKPHEFLVEWMSQNPQGQGSKALDVGCGLGDNAAFLASNGFDVTAIDLSPSAIDWATRRFEGTGIHFRQMDLFALPSDLVGQFDLVHETYTLQALPKDLSPKLFPVVGSLVAPKGRLLVICRSRAEDIAPDGPPWPLAKSELDRFLKEGLELVDFQEFTEEKPDGRLIPHFRAEYKKRC